MKNKKRRGGIILFVVALLVAALLTGLLMVNGVMNRIGRTSGVGSYVASSQETFERDSSAADTLKAEDVDFNDANIKVMKDDEVKNILLIGQDRRDGEQRERSDSMIICSINTKSKKIILTSVMRDMYIDIPGYSPNKLNAAYALGGMNLLDQVIEQNFGIQLDGNVEVDFDGFVEALSVVGNIKLTLTGEEAWYLNGGDWTDQGTTDNKTSWHLKEGTQEVTPEQALAYSRIRYIGNSDWERTERQRKVIMAAFDKVKSSDAGTMLRVANSVFPYLTTDLTNNELLGYVKTIAVDGISKIESYRIPVDGYYSEETIDGMSVLVPDLTMNSQYLQSYIYGTKVDETLARQNYISSSEAADGTLDSGYTDEGVADDGGQGYAGDTYSYSDEGDTGSADGTDTSTYTDTDGSADQNAGYVDADGDGYDDNTGEYFGG